MRLQEIRKKREKVEEKLAEILKNFEDNIGGVKVDSVKIIRSSTYNVIDLQEIVDTKIILEVY